MKKILFVVAGVLIVTWISCGILSGQSTITLDPVYDNDVCSASASTSIENTVYQSGALGVGCRWDYYPFTGQAFFCWESLVYFDVRSLAGATIHSAALELVVDSPGVGYYPRDWHIFALATPWNRATVTWANSLNQQHYTASKIVLDPPAYSGQTYNVDVTSIVRAWVNKTWGNYGLRFGSEDYTIPYATSYDDFHFYSFEDPGREWPKLFVTYERPTCTYSIDPASASYSFSGGSGSVAVTAPSGCAWTAKSNNTWITVTGGSSGSGNGTVNYSVAFNGGSSRSGTITIAGKTLTVNQGGNCLASINPTSAPYSSPGGNGGVAVTVPSGCAWTAKSNNTWITVTGGSSGSGNGTVNYSVAANSGAERSGTMTIAGKTFTVSQTGPSCTYSINPTSAPYSFPEGSGSVTVTAPSGCAWTAKSNNTWITVTGGSSGTGNGTVSYSVNKNIGTFKRTGTMTIAGKTFTVTQDGPQLCTFGLSSYSAQYGSPGGSGSVTVTAPSGCAWTAKSNNTWITVTGGSSGTGNGTVSYSVAAHWGMERTGTMTIAGKTFKVTQAVPSSCTYSINPDSFHYTFSGGGGEVFVEAPSGCAWTAKSNDIWITVTGGSSGSGNGTVNYSVAANWGVERNGTMTIAGKTLTINQYSTCLTSINPTSASYSAIGGSGSVTVTEAYVGCAWTAESHDTWITVTGGSSGSGNGTVTYSVAANSGAERNGSMLIAGQTFTLNQEGSSLFILPTQGTIGTLLTITGSGFGTKGSVKVGGKLCTVLGWDDGSITCVIKTALPSPGPYDVVVKPNKPKGILPIIFTGAFTMMEPGIVSINPASGSPGDVIEVSGKYFSTKIGGASLGYEKNGRFKWKKCKVTEWFMDPVNGDSSIRFIVPKTTKNFPVGTYFLRVTNKTGGWESIRFSVK